METEGADAEGADAVPCITRGHFEEAMRHARRSVSEADMRRYESFKATLQQSRGIGGDFRFAEAQAAAPAGAAPAGAPPAFGADDADGDDDDLYS